MNLWSYHDEKMKSLKHIYNKVSKQTQNRLQEIFDSFNITFDNLYNIADTKLKGKIDTYIEEWKDKGLLNGYFGMLANNIYRRTRVKNSEILELLIYSAYIEEQNKLQETELNTFKDVANYYYNEGQKEVNKKKKASIIPDAIFLALLAMPNVKGWTYDMYIQTILKYNADQIYRQALINLQQQKELKIDSDAFQNIIKKQQNTRLTVNGDKISGDIDLTLIGINNMAKVEGIASEDDNAKVMFLANIDGKETEMCNSLNNQTFYINKENEFDRYYGETQKELAIRRIKCKGLVLGLNLPPISHHFHYCRSAIQYIPTVEKIKKIEYNYTDNFLRLIHYEKNKHKNYELDYEMAATEYQNIPENVRNMLEREGVTFRFDYTRTSSGYNQKTKEIILIPDLVEGETTHEIGHAIFEIQKVKTMPEYKKIVEDIFKQSSGPDIMTDRVEEYYYLKTRYVVDNEYQVFLGKPKETNEVVNNILNSELPELFSEAYRIRYFGGKQSQELNKLIEKVEKNVR